MLENANLDNDFFCSVIGDRSVSAMILGCLSLKEQSKARAVSRAIWLAIHDFWIANDIYVPLHNNWTGVQMSFKVLFCGPNKNSFIPSVANDTTSLCCDVQPSNYEFVQRNIRYGFWSAPNFNSRYADRIGIYARGTHIAVLCYENAEDLDNLEEVYAKIIALSPNAKIIMACAYNNKVCKEKLACFANGREITYFCTITSSSELKSVINRFGFQIATEVTVQQRQANAVKAIEPANCLVQ